MRNRILILVVTVLLLTILSEKNADASWVPDGLPVALNPTPNPYEFQATSDGTGGSIITWQDVRWGGGTSTVIYAQRIDANGTVQWTTDGIAICAQSSIKTNLEITSDGFGGAIIAWCDDRNGNDDIYAQRIDASGVIQWTADGVAICTFTEDQLYPRLISNGSGGAIIIWQDFRSEANYDIYAQLINSSGVIQWTAEGEAVCTAAAHKSYHQIIPDGSGGAVISWMDIRGGTDYDIYAQRIDASGEVQWTADGEAVCTFTEHQQFPRLISNGSGGAIVTWRDYRSGTSDDIYAQLINSSGVVQWTSDGEAVCSYAEDQGWPDITTDGSGGAIITWYDYRSGNWDIYAQRIDVSGTIQWTTDGEVICDIAENQLYPRITYDGSGGAIITWRDLGSGTNGIYAQRVDASGIAQWTTDGKAICVNPDSQSDPLINSDGAGGAVITWKDTHSINKKNIYSQRIDFNGEIQWTANGEPICTYTNNQDYPRITSDGFGGTIITWQDNRSATNYDIYAQRVDVNGVIQWTTGGVEICTGSETQDDPQITSDGAGGAIIAWRDERNGNLDIFAQRVDANGVVQWTPDGVAVCTAAETQYDLRITTDSAGGAILSWADNRSGSSEIYAYDIYTQRINENGISQWTHDGAAICTAISIQLNPEITADGFGGAVVTWEDYRSGDYDVYAQRINASSVAQWAPDGVAVCIASGNQFSQRITTDGTGGAIISWVDWASDNDDIYAQRISASGVAQWAANGEAICTFAGSSPSYHEIVSDGSGGAIISWEDYRNANFDIYAQRIDGSGTHQWTTDGESVCTAAGIQENAQITSDGFGGAVITWSDYRSGTSYDIYAQRMDATGTARWTVDGEAICTYTQEQTDPQITSDASGRAVITWADTRGDESRIYAQAVTDVGFGPICEVFPASIMLPDLIQVGTAADTVFTISNAGLGPLVGFVSEDYDHFSIVSGAGSFYLLNGESHNVTVRFEPTDPGSHSCTIDTGVYVCTDMTLTGHAYSCSVGDRLYVDADATGVERGDSWADAYVELRDALEVAGRCPYTSEIWVADGTYLPTDGTDRYATFHLRDSLVVYGGFAGGETQLSERDVTANPTVLSGDINVAAEASDNCYHVVTSSYLGSSAVLDGFIISGGNANEGGAESRGGGLNNLYGNPVISNVTFSGNSAFNGGGMHSSYGSPALSNVIFAGNFATVEGGGIWITGGSVTISNALFSGNHAGYGGGGMATGACTSTITNVTFTGNSANYGGALYNWIGGNPTLVNSVLWSNSAAISGDEIHNNSSTPVISYSLIEGSGGSGGGWDSSLGGDAGNNVDGDPLFANAPGGDFRLTSGSSAIDAGNNSAPNILPTDIEGNPRVDHGTVDMGAYESIFCPALIYVDKDATGAGDGTSWADAYPELSEAMTAVLSHIVDETQIWVAEGTYTPTYGTDRGATFPLLDGLTIYGGFAGSETMLSERDWAENVTILSGDIGAVDDSNDNSYHVVLASNAGPTAVLDGFTIINGQADGAGSNGSGGGLCIIKGSPIVLNLVFTHNYAEEGGGVCIGADSAPRLINVIFSGNSASNNGGGLANYGSVTALINAVFTRNATSGKDGGGLYVYSESEVTLTNITLIRNTAARNGGGMYIGGGSSAEIVNTIFWDNSADVGGEPEIHDADGGTSSLISYSLIAGSKGSSNWNTDLGVDRGNNIDADPLFVDDSSGGDLRLQPGSPAIDTGDNSSPFLFSTDVTGYAPRIQNGTVDMGAYEGGVTPIQVTMASDPPGLEVYWDEIDILAPWTFTAGAGDSIEISAGPQMRGDTLFSFMSWSDGGDAVHSVIVPDTDVTYTATFSFLVENAVIDSIADVSADQGGWARVYFRRSIHDDPLETTHPIARYDIHRRVDSPALSASIIAEGKPLEDDHQVTLVDGSQAVLHASSGEEVPRYLEYDGRYFMVQADGSAAAPPGIWEVTGTVSAQQQPYYISLVPTLGDSASTIPWSVYYISAHTTTPAVYFESPPDSGYSVDNIAPGVPQGLAVAYNTGSGNQLSWDTSPEPDFQYYRIYRGDSETFVPGPGDLVEETSTPGWSDPDYDGWDVHYKVTALDHAGNESEASSVVSTTGDDTPGAPGAFALYQNVPNPFNPATTIRFDLPKASHVRLDVYNVKGELVSTIVDRHMSEGQKEVNWAARDSSGRTVTSGVYFYRLVAGDFVQTRKMVLLR